MLEMKGRVKYRAWWEASWLQQIKEKTDYGAQRHGGGIRAIGQGQKQINKKVQVRFPRHIRYNKKTNVDIKERKYFYSKGIENIFNKTRVENIPTLEKGC